jgi:hypothetical protein
MREGIEDYELLNLLAQRDPAKAHSLAQRDIAGMTEYVRDVPTFRVLQAQLLDAFNGPAPVVETAPAPQRRSMGPLRVLPDNPRWLTDGSGRAIYLAGSHTWNDFIDTGHRRIEQNGAPPVFDYSGYLDSLSRRHDNFFRLWRQEVPQFTDEDPPGVKHADPMPWMRVGPELAADGKPKFDLTRFNPAYFERMRSRVTAAGDRGMYVSVMLFEGWFVQFLPDAWNYHPFNPANNVNGIDGGRLRYYTLDDSDMGRRVLGLQEAYIRKVIDTVGDLDNVLYEVCNEAGPYSTAWQYHVIRYVKQIESQRPKQHPVGMTFQYPGGTNDALFNSPADWISPNNGEPETNYVSNPPSSYGGKVIVSDTDHLLGHTGGDIIWVWKSFLRGLNVLFMEEMTPSPTWQDSAREGMRQTRLWSEKIDLAHMTPHDALASGRYCLANPGVEYLALQPEAAEFTIDLTGAPGDFTVQWLDVNTGREIPGKPVHGGGKVLFIPPFGGPAVVHLKSSDH